MQADIWQYSAVQEVIENNAVLFSLEGGLRLGDVPIRLEPYTRRWVAECFGDDALQAVLNGTVACSGG